MSSRKLHPGAAVVLAAVVVLSACTDEPTTQPSPTNAPATAAATPSPSQSAVPTAAPTPTPSPTPSPPSTSSPTAPASPSPSPTVTAVPDDLSTIADDGEVTVAEAQAVIDVQNQIYNDALLEYLRTRLDTGSVGTDFPDAVVSIMTDDLATDEVDLWELAFQNEPEKINTEDPQPVREDVRQVLGSSDSCVSLLLRRDTGGLSVGGTPPSTWVMRLVDARTGAARNESGWYRDALTLAEFRDEEDASCPA